MNTQTIWSISGAIIASFGGAGLIISAILTFLSKRIENRMDLKYQQRLNKELEKYKSILDQRRHVTKAQFDHEFETYRKLSDTFSSMIFKLSYFTNRESDIEIVSQIRQEISIEEIKDLFGTITEAQKALYANVAFIPKDIYELYDSIMKNARTLYWRFDERAAESALQEGKIENIINDDDKLLEKSIENDFDTVNLKLRDYLQSLAVVE